MDPHLPSQPLLPAGCKPEPAAGEMPGFPGGSPWFYSLCSSHTVRICWIVIPCGAINPWKHLGTNIQLNHLQTQNLRLFGRRPKKPFPCQFNQTAHDSSTWNSANSVFTCTHIPGPSVICFSLPARKCMEYDFKHYGAPLLPTLQFSVGSLQGYGRLKLFWNCIS